MTRLERGAAAVLWLGTLGACSVLPSPAPPRYEYLVLTTSALAAPVAGGVTVAIDDVRLPAYLERAELVTRLSDNQIQFSPRARWAEPLSNAVPRVLADDLATALAGSGVRVVARGGDADLALDIAVDQLEGPVAGPVRVRARWSLRRAGQRALAGSGQLTADEPVRGPSAETAAALSRLLVRLSTALAADVRGHAAATPADPAAP